MEESMAVLYRNVAAGTQDGAVKGLLLRLATVEDRHKTRLLGLIELDGPDLAPFKGGAAAGIIEGGFGVRDFLSENKGFAGAMTDILDLSMTLETQALDLYLRLARRLENARAREVLFEIADEEKGHLAALAALRDERA
jgi:rubrerythrin